MNSQLIAQAETMIPREWRQIAGQCAITLILIAAFTSTCPKAAFGPANYLDWPKVDYTQRDDYHAKIRLALEKGVHEINFPARDDSTTRWFEQAVEQVAKASERGEKFTSEERNVFWHIHSLDSEDNACGQRELDLYRSLRIQLKDRKLPAEWQDLIETACKKFIWRCSLKRDSSRWSFDAELEKQLDVVWAAAFDESYRGDIHKNGLGYRLATVLKDFDLATSNFNAKRALELMRKSSDMKGAAFDGKPLEPFELMRKFMLNRCDKFGLMLNITIDLMDLIREAGFRFVNWTNPDLDRMDEYRRLCLALRRPEREGAIRANLVRLLTPKGVKDKLADKVQKCLRCL